MSEARHRSDQRSRRSPARTEWKYESIYPKLSEFVGATQSYRNDVYKEQFCTEDSSSSIERVSEEESDHLDTNASPERPHSTTLRSQTRTRYDSVQNDPEGSENFNIKFCMAFVVAAFVVAVIAVRSYDIINFRRTVPHDDSILKRYRQQMVRLLKEKYPLEQSNTRNILRLFGEKWIAPEPREPYVVLITGSKAREFATDIASVFTKTFSLEETEVIFCDTLMERRELDRKIEKSFSKQRKTVILNDIDKLRGETPLSLHGLCDPNHSTHPSTLILLTVTRTDLGTFPECEQALSSLLSDEWQTGFMDKDRISPVLSRITSYVICLEA